MWTPRLALLLLVVSSAAGAINVEGGQIEGVAEGGLTAYRGIPFAAPPVGDLRWRPPQPAADWDGVKRTSQFGPACMQGGPAPSVGMSEDCLYLNVWTPAQSPNDRLPVLVWIYGGGFSAGRTSSPNQTGEKLAKRGVVVVSIAYRVGSFGFLAHPGLSKESEQGVSGNYGLLDQIAGLRWIRDNIAQFGGDPDKVTIFGESAGGIAVSMLCASPVAKGLFHGAISQSGGSFGPPRGQFPGENMVLLPSAEEAGAAFTASFGASTIDDARDLSAQQLVAAARGPGGGVAWPIIDGWVLPDDQYKLYEAGRYNDTPILVGYNSDEGLSFTRVDTPEAFIQGVHERFGPYADKMLAEYPVVENDIPKTARDLARDAAFGWHTWAWARLQSQQSDSKVFFYYFDQHPDYPAGSEREGHGSPHGMDVAFVFDQLEFSNRQEHPSDQAVSDAMADYWTNFAKHGDPNGEGLQAWPEFRDENPELMYFHHRPYVGPVPTPDGLAALEEYFAWRRTPEGEAFAGTATGIAAKKPVFGGACRLCPWGAMAEFVRDAMEPYGYDVQVCYNCNAADAPRIVAEARTPPPYRPSDHLPEILAPRNTPGLGAVDFGAVAVSFLRNAYRGTAMYAADGPRRNLRLIANIQDPSYVLVAATAETGITDLSQVREKRWPVRIFSAGIGGANVPDILAHYGLSPADIEAAGGAVGNTPELRENFDVVIGGAGVMTTAPEWDVWTEISLDNDLVFLDLPADLLAKLAASGDQQLGTVPVGLYPGVVRPLPTVVRTGTVVYGRDNMPDDFAYAVAKAIDEQQHLLQWKHLAFSYNIHKVWKAFEVPLHPGAERYYKERGYTR